MVIIVWIFVKFLKDMMVSHSKRTDEFIDTVKEINADNLIEKRESRDAIRENTRATSDMTTALTRLINNQK